MKRTKLMLRGQELDVVSKSQEKRLIVLGAVLVEVEDAESASSDALDSLPVATAHKS